MCYTIIVPKGDNNKETRGENKMEKFDKRMLKKSPEELQQYLAFRRKAGRVPAKKGKGSYNRRKERTIERCAL